MWQRLGDTLKRFWNSLSHKQQATVLMFVSVTLEALGHALEHPDEPLNRTTLTKYVAHAVMVGWATAKLYYLNPGTDAVEKPRLPNPNGRVE